MTDFSAYTVSIHYDRRLFRQDIAGSAAHARMLARQDIISQEDADSIVRGLETIRQEIERDEFPWNPSLEDLHMNVESRLHQLIGPSRRPPPHGPLPERPDRAGHAALHSRGHRRRCLRPA